MRQIRVAIGQMPGVLNDTQANLHQACMLAVQAAADGARLLLLPEGCLTGNALSVPERQEALPLDPAAFTVLQAVADAARMTICAGFHTRVDGKFNAVHAILQPCVSPKFQRKAARAESEPVFLTPWPDPERVVFEVDGVRVAIVICSEMGQSAVMGCVGAKRPDLLLHPSAGREPQDALWRAAPSMDVREGFRRKTEAIVSAACRRVKEERTARVCANPVGFDGETYWPGNSYGISADGSVALHLAAENDPMKMNPGVLTGAVAVTNAARKV